MEKKELNEQELSSYLAEINSREAAELPDYLLSDKAWINNITKDENGKCYLSPELTENVYGKKRNKARKQHSKNSITRAQRRKEIIQNALENPLIDLNAQITHEQIKLLIKNESDKYTNYMKMNEESIKSNFYNFIKSRLPKIVKLCWEEYPQIMIPMEPFDYKASEDFGQGKIFKVEINLPSYFKPNEIIDLMQNLRPDLLIIIDKTVVNFYKHKETRSKAENRLANRLLYIKTFYQLLKKDPFLFEELVSIIKN